MPPAADCPPATVPMPIRDAADGRATPAKVRTLLNLAVSRAEQAATMAETLGMAQRASSIRTAAGKLTEQLHRLGPSC